MRVGAGIEVLKAVNIGANATYYTNSIDVGSHGTNFGIKVKATSVTSTPKYTVQYQESDVRPTTEGAADTEWAIPQGAPDICTDIIVETPIITSISLVPMNFLRFKIITAALGHDADSLFTLKFFKQEE